ncbi:MAG: hypothetical protein L0154_12950 [Chloroflexi bacterium]|nr:hypothetical protein [Chloroflexota bacterium]
MGHFEHTLQRLLVIEWWEPVEPSQFDALAMINEHFRRIALWCDELNIEDTSYWHFTNLTEYFHPDLMMPDNDLLNEERRIEIPGVAGTTRLIMHNALDWAYLTDVYPEISALYDHMPHPYEAALKVFEKRIAIGYHDYSYEYRMESITEEGYMMIGPIFELRKPEYYLQLTPYHDTDV